MLSKKKVIFFDYLNSINGSTDYFIIFKENVFENLKGVSNEKNNLDSNALQLPGIL